MQIFQTQGNLNDTGKCVCLCVCVFVCERDFAFKNDYKYYNKLI